MQITKNTLQPKNLHYYCNEEEKEKAISFLEKLKVKINLNPTIEKIAFYRILENRIIDGEVEFDMKGKGRFLLSVFGHAEKDRNGEKWNYPYQKDGMRILGILSLFVPEFFETINESFELGENLELPNVPKDIPNEICKDELVERFWLKVDPILSIESTKVDDNGNENTLFLLLMKYLKASKDNLPINNEDNGFFYSAYRKFDIIDESLKGHTLKIKGADLKLTGAYDMIVWHLFCSAMNEAALTKKERELFDRLSSIINNHA